MRYQPILLFGVLALGNGHDHAGEGEQGEQGEPGKDGFSPFVTVRKVDKTTVITITDADSEHVAVIEDGSDGMPEFVTDDEVLAYLMELDLLVTVTDGDGSILTDENDNILIW